MTEQEARSQRRRAFDLIAAARARVNPTTTEHIAETAMRHSDEELDSYARFVGWKMLVGLQEDNARADWRPTRSGHKNRSGRYSLLQTPWRIGELAKPLGEMTLPDLQVLVAGYEKRAEENLAEAGRLRAIADAVEAAGVEKVADLGEERVRELYRGEIVNA